MVRGCGGGKQTFITVTSRITSDGNQSIIARELLHWLEASKPQRLWLNLAPKAFKQPEQYTGTGEDGFVMLEILSS